MIPWTAACEASLSITNSRSSPKPMSIESVMPSNHLILHHPLLLLPSILPSIRVFSNKSALRIRWPKYWSFSLWSQRSLKMEKSQMRRLEWYDVRETWPAILALKTGEGGHELRNWKRQGNSFSSRACEAPTKEGSPPGTLILAVWDLCQSSNLQNAKVIHLYYFKPRIMSNYLWPHGL